MKTLAPLSFCPNFLDHDETFCKPDHAFHQRNNDFACYGRFIVLLLDIRFSVSIPLLRYIMNEPLLSLNKQVEQKWHAISEIPAVAQAEG